jgi:hypothetical protein
MPTPMRRIALVVVAALAALAVAGCSGADAQRAEELLEQSNRALADVTSYGFAGRLWVEGSGIELVLVMRGGGTTKGKGASFVDVRAEGIPGFPPVSVVTRGRTLWVRAGGSWTRAPLPDGQPSGLEQFDLSPYVKDVSVGEGPVLAGEPTAKITGVVDTAQLLTGFLGQVGGISGGGMSLPDVSEAFGDTRVVLYVSETTQLPLRALVDMSAEAAGERVELHMDFALSHFDEPVKVPNPGA